MKLKIQWQEILAERDRVLIYTAFDENKSWNFIHDSTGHEGLIMGKCLNEHKKQKELRFRECRLYLLVRQFYSLTESAVYDLNILSLNVYRKVLAPVNLMVSRFL